METARCRLALSVLALSVLSGCSKSSPAAPRVEANDDTSGRKQKGLLADVITIEFSKPEYVFTLAEVAKGVKFDYTIKVTKDINGVIPLPLDDGLVARPGPSGLCPFEQIAGGGQSYSLRDVGLAQPREIRPGAIKEGKYPKSFEWDGRNWTGPSDFDNPKGDPFPPGDYTLTVVVAGELATAEGKKPFRLTSNVPLKLTR